MTVEQGLRAEFHDRPKVLARALRAAREQGTIGNEYISPSNVKTFDWKKTKEGYWYWDAVCNGSPNPDQYLTKGYVDVEDEQAKDSGSIPSRGEAISKGFEIAIGSEYNRRKSLADADDDLYYTGWMDCYDWITGNKK